MVATANFSNNATSQKADLKKKSKEKYCKKAFEIDIAN